MKNKNISLSDKIYIAGASGMAGSAIYRSLKRLNYGNKSNGAEILCPKRNELDLLNTNQVQDWFEKNKPDVVILAAALVGGINANSKYPSNFLLDNLKIQNNVIETSFKNGVKRLMFLGSSCIYPKFAKQPIKEEYLLDGILERTNEGYAIAKIAGLKLCEFLRKQYGFDSICLMPTNLYGPGDNYHPENSHVMAALISRIYRAKKNCDPDIICWGSGKPLREFLHVDDLGDAVVFALEEWNPNSSNAPRNENGEILTYLNVGTGKDISIKELALKIARIINYKGKILWDKSRPDGTPKKQLNIERLKLLGWEPKIRIDEGIKNTILSFESILDN